MCTKSTVDVTTWHRRPLINPSATRRRASGQCTAPKTRTMQRVPIQKATTTDPILRWGWRADWRSCGIPNSTRQPKTKEGAQHRRSLWCMAWMAILGNKGSACLAAKADGDNFASDANKGTDQCWGYAKTGSFLLPPGAVRPCPQPRNGIGPRGRQGVPEGEFEAWRGHRWDD